MLLDKQKDWNFVGKDLIAMHNKIIKSKYMLQTFLTYIYTKVILLKCSYDLLLNLDRQEPSYHINMPILK